MDGRHRHIFLNPGGFVYEIGCFAVAPGAGVVSQPPLENTWFPGYAWQIAVCRACQFLMGWKYTASGAPPFWGLIIQHLVEEPDPASPPPGGNRP